MSAPVRLQSHVWNPLGDRRALLLHGLTADGTCWWRLASELAEAGWMVVAPDLRGHGRSPATAGYDLPGFAADVALLGDSWEVVVGHSLGGAVAAHLLAGEGCVRAAVLIDPVLALGPDIRDRLRAELLAEIAGLTADAVRRQHPHWHERDVQRAALAAARCTPDVVAGVFDDNDPWDLLPLARRWTARVHLLGADPTAGGLLDPALAAALIAEVADGGAISAEVVVGCGHSIERERPEVVSAAVARVTTDEESAKARW